MKVLQIYRTCFPTTHGGIEQVIRYIAKGGNEYGVETKILSLSDSNGLLNVEGSEIHLAKRNFSIKSNCFSFSAFYKAKELIKWADIIHFHYPWPSGDLLSFLVKDKPIVVTYHSDIVKQNFLKILYSPLERVFLKKANRIIVTSDNYLNSSQTLVSYKDKCEVIPLGIDFTDYDEIDPEIHQKYYDEYGNGFYLFVGVLRYYKGLNYLIEAAGLSGLPVVIAGNGPEFDVLKEKIESLNLKNVYLLGFVSDLERNSLLSLCRAFVFPSHLRSEAFGVSLIESLYFAKPIISCEIGTGTSYVNKNNETGIVIEAANSSALSNAMLSLVDANLCEKYSSGAAQRSKQFSYRAMTKKHVDLYRELIQ
jgi:glycosyltransferase involved in cell wall biosynthesis